MDRRNFLKFLGMGAAAVVAERVFPFRVYSFPTEIQTPAITLDGIPYFVDPHATSGVLYGLDRGLKASDVIALQIEHIQPYITDLFREDGYLAEYLHGKIEIVSIDKARKIIETRPA